LFQEAFLVLGLLYRVHLQQEHHQHVDEFVLLGQQLPAKEIKDNVRII
jgi:hypothetical protein